MILVYTLLLALLATASFLIGRRAARLERKYYRAAEAADRVLRATPTRPGNGNKADVCTVAKQQYLLGRLVQQRDQLEQRYVVWQKRAARVRGWTQRLREWKGKKLPYTLGALDVTAVLGLIDYLGVGQHVSAGRLVQLITSWFQG
jgi:hypothetical protein